MIISRENARYHNEITTCVMKHSKWTYVSVQKFSYFCKETNLTNNEEHFY